MLSGDLFIGGERRAAAYRFLAQDPALGAAITEPGFAEASARSARPVPVATSSTSHSAWVASGPMNRATSAARARCMRFSS